MIESLVHYIQNFLIPFGATGVFVASVLEEVVAPIPSAFVLTFSGFFLIQEHTWSLAAMKDILFSIAIPGALGVTIGSLLVYGIGYGAGKPLLERWGGFFGISWGEVEKMERRFARGYSDEVTLFLIRAFPFIPSVVISTFCGLIRLPLREYFLFSFLGTIIRAFILALIGWQVGALYARFASLISTIENGVLVATAFFLAAFGIYRVFRKRHK